MTTGLLKTGLLTGLAGLMLTGLGAAARAQTPVGAAQTLQAFSVTIRRFDPAKGLEAGEDFVLPVDSPDAEHAVSSTMANAVSWTTKVEGGKPASVAFTCIKVERR